MKAIPFSPAQQEAVELPGGPLLVAAGPGAGKTRTLTARIAHFVRERSVPPGSIAALTFTHRAAGEMAERLEALLGGEAMEALFIGTFHSFGLGLIREEHARLGFAAPPRLYDEIDRELLLRELIAKREPSSASARTLLAAVLDRAGKVAGSAAGSAAVEDVRALYRERKKAEDAIDFDDCIALPVALLSTDPERLAAWRGRLRHFFVDEYQDVNAAQVELLRLLAGGAESLTAIGDPDQAIYSFRGSDVRFFLDFGSDFPGAAIRSLSDNFRSTVTIVSASEQIIRHNRSRGDDVPPCRPAGAKGLHVAVHRLASDRAEAAFVAERIGRLVGGLGRFGLDEGMDGEDGKDAGFGEIAVLYRLNAQARLLCEALEKAGIPFQRVGTGAAERRSAEAGAGRAVLALARLAESRARRGEAPAGAPQRTLSALGLDPSALVPGALTSSARVSDAPIPEAGGDAAALLLRAGETLGSRLPDRAEQFARAARELAGRAAGAFAGQAAGVFAGQAAGVFAGRAGAPAGGAGTLSPAGSSFLAAAPLVQAEDPFAARAEKVTLSTIHAAKGLEFPILFIAGMEEGLVPYLREDEPDRDAALEEERRLLYVGMTRARERLFLTGAQRRFLYGEMRVTGPSPFLEEISEDLVRFVRRKARTPRKNVREKDPGQGNLF